MTLRKMRTVSDDNYSLDDSFSSRRGGKCITQAKYYRAGDVVIAIGELNQPNVWDDDAFDAACRFLQKAWNERLSATTGEAS